MGLKVKNLGLKVLEDKGISISGSSKPTSTTPVSATPGFAYTYSICMYDENDDSSEVLIVNTGPNDILGECEKFLEG